MPKAPPGEGATVSFLRKQKSSRCPSCASRNPGFFAPTPRVIPAQAAVQNASPHRGRGRRCPRHPRVRYCVGSQGVFLGNMEFRVVHGEAPWDVGTSPFPWPSRGRPYVSSCVSRNPRFFAPAPGHSRTSSSPVHLSPGRQEAGGVGGQAGPPAPWPKVSPVKGLACHCHESGSPENPRPWYRDCCFGRNKPGLLLTRQGHIGPCIRLECYRETQRLPNMAKVELSRSISMRLR